MKLSKNHEIEQKPWNWAKTMKFPKHQKNKQNPWNFINLKTSKNHENFMKISNNYQIFPTLWNKQKPENLADFMKISKNHKILPTSWKQAKSTKFWQLHENNQKPCNFGDFKTLWHYDIMLVIKFLIHENQ